MRRKKTYSVIYREGGHARYKWHRTIAQDYKEVEKTRISIEKQGYHCFITSHKRSKAIGLPETFGPNDKVYDVVHLGNGWMKQKNVSER